MREEGRTFKGVLYVGLMLTDGGPKVLEYNCRFGDPETQVQMIRLESDLVELMLNADERKRPEVRGPVEPQGRRLRRPGLGGLSPGLRERQADQRAERGFRRSPASPSFTPGRSSKTANTTTNGGRVLNVCACEPTLAETMENIYSAMAAISFDGLHFRRDIGLVR